MRVGPRMSLARNPMSSITVSVENNTDEHLSRAPMPRSKNLAQGESRLSTSIKRLKNSGSAGGVHHRGTGPHPMSAVPRVGRNRFESGVEPYFIRPQG